MGSKELGIAGSFENGAANTGLTSHYTVDKSWANPIKQLQNPLERDQSRLKSRYYTSLKSAKLINYTHFFL